MPYQPLPDLASLSLAELAEAAAARKLPPVEEWEPTEEVASTFRIAADGTWFHEGTPIRRPAMIRAFASLLVKDRAGRHALVTPRQRHPVDVEDAAFIATDMIARDDALAFRLNTDEVVIASPEHPLRAAGDPDCPAIYLAVRHGCEARLDRSTWLQLASHMLEHGDGLAVQSQGARFALIPA